MGLRMADIQALGDVGILNRFVRQVLLGREPGATLAECEIDLRGFSRVDGTCADLWIRHGSRCHVQVLQVRFYAEERVVLADWPLFSRRLVRLELHGIALRESFLDFSSCPVLEDLEITNCLLAADKILSGSLKLLKITGCELIWLFVPTHISARNDYVGVTPILESMPSLEKASVKLGQNNEDYCDYCDNGGSGEYTSGVVSVFFLEVCQVRHIWNWKLPLKWDLRCCPTFINLKTLLLNDWCLVADIHALLCFLQHTPILEKLILQLCKVHMSSKYDWCCLFRTRTQDSSFKVLYFLQKPKAAVETEGSNLMEYSLTLRQLKIVEVKCPTIVERVQNVLKILRACTSCLDQVIVQEI
ncbi:hypothetical protein GQ55_8G147300 [Panicum hallii var. hallii]|uniref:Uncharacterized protein n=1 Tax=Panicum hallii var. hallii TaxID=1504633 RepID=A0A2T7CN77_9POAL|nr:hypothetical protein GQ55_8G147300 [Panicum hallii var. hallii]